jgi:hypothetical protein
MMTTRGCSHGACPAAELPAMCSYLPQTSIPAAACSIWGCGLRRGGQRCMGQLCLRGPRVALHVIHPQVVNRCFLASAREKREDIALVGLLEGQP